MTDKVCMKLGIAELMTAQRHASIEADDNKWDAKEIGALTEIARSGDSFDTDGVSFMVNEFNSATTFEPAAAKQLFEVLVHEAKVDPKKLTGAPPEVVLAVQSGSSNKFSTMAVDGSDLVTRYGKIGTDGKTDTKSFASAADARKQMMSALRGKMKKGYAPVDPSTIGLAATPAAKPASANSFGLDQFLALDEDERQDLLEGYGDAPAGTNVVEKDLKDFTDPKQIAFAKKLRDQAADDLSDFDVHSDEHLTVGDPSFDITLLVAENGDVLGGSIYVNQMGIDYPDDYWDNEDAYDDATLKKMADDEDVSWSATGIYSATKNGNELETLRHPDYMEWGGY